jgi:hypothetical protein
MTDLKKLDDAILELEKQSNNLHDFNKVYSEIDVLKKGIEENLNLLKNNNDNFFQINEDIITHLGKSFYKLESIEDLISTKIQELYKDNQSFQRELDASIISRLDKHRSDIQVEIRNEGIQIQRSFELSLKPNLQQIETSLKNEVRLQTKQFTALKILVSILIGIGLVMLYGLYMS